ncbi:CD276 antigen homolog isoform X2 [Brienomyrus brachyistius]|uniref:CD276 antigen homolog isoform X1 n=1 Tax=Brienomyrus brachyistius TaxID=42636 RepID=UPI0020B2993D|nr:CD276 antigen homolog isoform X1 [Brienomyrus brachyistius]XP_048855137.1 CD276 antigen homolog isoform X2 [Brienomyrus brachyistius]
MWTRYGSSWLWFLTFLSHRVLAGELVDGYMGGDVILPCVGGPSSTTQPTVYWRFQHNRNVFDVIEGAHTLQTQDPQFKDRTSAFPAKYSKGNFSLLLTNLSSTDAGQYSCYIIKANIQRDVTLQVKAKPTTDIMTPGHSDSTDDRTPKTPLLLLSLLGSVLPHLYR